MEITEPLVLTTGAHVEGEGRGCAMEVLSWTMGGKFTDTPDCSDLWLSAMVQQFNDTVGTRYGTKTPLPSVAGLGQRELLPEHAMMALDLAIATVGTKVRCFDSTMTEHIMRADAHALMFRAQQVAGLCPQPVYTDPMFVIETLIDDDKVTECFTVIMTVIDLFKAEYRRPVVIPSGADVDAAIVRLREEASA